MNIKITGSNVFCFFLIGVGSAFGSTNSNGVNGINSSTLGLTGAGIGIGQVEPGRPGLTGFDPPGMVHADVNPTSIFRQDGAANLADADAHALQVAGVMISSNAGVLAGVAPDAELYASADNGSAPDFDPESALAAQHVATRNGGDIRAINFSFGNPLAAGAKLDGNSLLTQFVDWSASVHDTLYVVAGNEGTMIPIPTDNYNGLTVGFSDRVGGVYRRVDSGNTFTEDAFGERTSIDLIAPGEMIEMTDLGSVGTTAPHPSGTSFAAPHVTGTVALLQEHADIQIAASAPNWAPNARRHEVMKAVLMNSADKLIDNGTVTVPSGLPIPTGGLLGMERTVVKQDGTSTWFDSFAWDDSVDSGTGGDTPLDEEMGAGHLNASRALQQFATGEQEEFGVSGATVPVIGWDYGTTTGDNDINRYRFNQELEAGSFIAITLAWDREVEFDVDGGTTGVYDIGDTFVEYVDPGFGYPADPVITDLDLYFQPAFAGNVNQARAYSTGNGTLQHIFFQVETTGEFEFWVRQTDEDVGVSQDYAVAWWALGTGPLIAGDFDNDGDVDGADFLVWQRDTNVGSLSDWQSNYGAGTLSSAMAVPEPTSLFLLLAGVLAWPRTVGRDG